MSLSRILSGNPDQGSRWHLLAAGLFVLLWFAADMHEYAYFIKDAYSRPEPAHAQDIINMNGPAFNPDFYKSWEQVVCCLVVPNAGRPVRSKDVGKR